MITVKNLLLIWVLFTCVITKAQNNPQIDSLINIASNAKADTNKVKLLNNIALMYRGDNPTTAMKYAEEALKVAEDIKSKDGMAMANNTIGSLYRETNRYAKALKYFFKSLALNEELNNERQVAKNLGNIGKVYREMADYPKALEYFGKAYAMNKKLNSAIGITNNLSDMGIICAIQKDHDKAMGYFNEALKVSEASNDKEGVAIVCGNIANIYLEQKDAESAISYQLKALQINEELGRKVGVASSLTNLGSIHYEIAIDSIKPKRYSMIVPEGKEANLNKAQQYFERSVKIYEEISYLNGLQEAYQALSNVYVARANYEKAMEYYVQSQSIKDSIFTVDKKVKLANLGAERAEYEKEQQMEITRLLKTKRRNETLFFIGSLILLSAIIVFVIKERRKSEKLLLNILPSEVAHELKQKGNINAKHFDDVTVLFTDFVNFTDAGQRMTPQQLVDELHACFKVFDEIISKYKIEKIKTIGDAYLAVSGLPVADPNHAYNIVNAAIEINTFISERKARLGLNAFEVRIGIHSGNVVAGIVGVKKFAYDIWGDTVNTAARMEQNSEPGKINISQTTYDLIKDQFECAYRGEIDAKNKGMMAMYFVEGRTA